MANEKHLEILKKGVKEWNEWRNKHPKEQPDLSGADLSGADLSGAHLEEANLIEAEQSSLMHPLKEQFWLRQILKKQTLRIAEYMVFQLGI